jgi:hypothetical protein
MEHRQTQLQALLGITHYTYLSHRYRYQFLGFLVTLQVLRALRRQQTSTAHLSARQAVQGITCLNIRISASIHHYNQLVRVRTSHFTMEEHTNSPILGKMP